MAPGQRAAGGAGRKYRAPVVAHYVFYGAGSGEDPQGIGGVAHFMEHMMFSKGSGNVPSGDFSRPWPARAGRTTPSPARDVTAYYQHVESSRLALVMRMEADRMAGLCSTRPNSRPSAAW